MDLNFHICMIQKSKLISSQQLVFQLVFVSLMYLFIRILYFGCNLYSHQAYDIFYTRCTHDNTPRNLFSLFRPTKITTAIHKMCCTISFISPQNSICCIILSFFLWGGGSNNIHIFLIFILHMY